MGRTMARRARKGNGARGLFQRCLGEGDVCGPFPPRFVARMERSAIRGQNGSVFLRRALVRARSLMLGAVMMRQCKFAVSCPLVSLSTRFVMAPSFDISGVPCLKKEFWERPPCRDKGDRQAEKIYEAVGFTITFWEIAEQELARIYLLLLETSNLAAARGYGAIESNTGRRKVIEAAAQPFFGQYWDNKKVQRSFSSLIKCVEWAAKRRDDIAHGIGMSFVINGEDLGAFLMPPSYNTGRTTAFVENSETDVLAFTRARYRFISSDIREFGQKFQTLHQLIFQYQVLLNKRGDGTIPFVEAVTS
jgi:hypothetical protein